MFNYVNPYSSLFESHLGPRGRLGGLVGRRGPRHGGADPQLRQQLEAARGDLADATRGPDREGLLKRRGEAPQLRRG